MSVSTGKSLSKEVLLEKAGPLGGSALSILGALLVLIGFVLPWASCSGYNYSGWDLAVNGREYFDTSSSIFLCLVPFFALGLLGMALVLIPAALLKKIPAFVKPIAAALVTLLVFFACCPSVIFFARLQAARTNAGHYGAANYVHLGYGFWISMVGLLLALLGGLLAALSSGGNFLLKRKQPPAEILTPPDEAPPENPAF
jgi:hypothetical protein